MKAEYYRRLARLNYEAALAADDKIGYLPEYELVAPPPVMVLCAHCIELSFKAFLLGTGQKDSDVRKLGHDLSELWKACIDLGAKRGAIDEDLLAILSDLLVNHTLRYGEPSKMGRLPIFGPLQRICESSLELCGAPGFSELVEVKS
jgi:hypothetical protein